MRASADREVATKCCANPFAGAMDVTGVSGFHHQVAARVMSATPWGSNDQMVPALERGPRVASCRSGLLVVTATAAGAAMIAGIHKEVDLPVRGPAMTTDTSSHPWRTVIPPGTVFPIGRPWASGASRSAPGRSRAAVAAVAAGVIPPSWPTGAIRRANGSTRVRRPDPERHTSTPAPASTSSRTGTPMSRTVAFPPGHARCPVPRSASSWNGLPGAGCPAPPAATVTAAHTNPTAARRTTTSPTAHTQMRSGFDDGARLLMPRSPVVARCAGPPGRPTVCWCR